MSKSFLQITDNVSRRENLNIPDNLANYSKTISTPFNALEINSNRLESARWFPVFFHKGHCLKVLPFEKHENHHRSFPLSGEESSSPVLAENEKAS